jgi:hypothetical protein
METRRDVADAKRKKITVKLAKSTARAPADMVGYVEILKNNAVILTFWAWELGAMTANGDKTTLVFKGDQPWHTSAAVPIAEVRSALVLAQGLWNAHTKEAETATVRALRKLGA